MTLQRREALADQIVATQPTLRAFVRDMTTDLSAGSRDLVSYSFQRGFEAMWDPALADQSGLLERPLLVLWRQSVELAIKSALLETAGQIATAGLIMISKRCSSSSSAFGPMLAASTMTTLHRTSKQ
jgi:hypothetical protein